MLTFFLGIAISERRGHSGKAEQQISRSSLCVTGRFSVFGETPRSSWNSVPSARGEEEEGMGLPVLLLTGETAHAGS